MLLKKLLQLTSASPNVLFRDPFKAVETGQLILEIIGLANVDFDGARYIVFGIKWNVALGIGPDPETVHMEMQVPDSSDPPSGRTAQRESLSKFDFKQATVEVIGTINTSIARLMKTGRHATPTMDDRDREALQSFRQDAELPILLQGDSIAVVLADIQHAVVIEYQVLPLDAGQATLNLR